MKQIIKKEINIKLGEIEIGAIMRIPKEACGIVIFAHGSGSSRFSPRNNFVAEELANNKIGSILIDLLTEDEEENRSNVFDIELLSKRLVLATHFVWGQKNLSNLPVGYFGASTGAAAALKASALLGDRIKAVVSRGGRPDLAMDRLHYVHSPTLFIVGSLDTDVIELNNHAYVGLTSVIDKEISIIKGAGHLFEGEGELEQVSQLASKWFLKYFKE